MRKSFNKLMAAGSAAVLSVLVMPLAGHYAGVDMVASAHAEHGADEGGGEKGGKKGGKKYMGGKSKEGHESGDSGHKGSSSHGGGSKTLESTVLQPDAGHSSGHDAGHKGGEAGMGGPKFMGGGKGGEDDKKATEDGIK